MGQSLLLLLGKADPLLSKDRGSTISVTKHYSSTPAKLGGSIHASSRVIYDITIPVGMGEHADNGGLTALTVVKDALAVDNSFAVSLRQMGDRSSEIANALTSLPNAVIPSVTVNKVAVTDSGTNDAGTNGNSYLQSYAITFNSESNAGDQNMLSCNAAPCDEDGCLNRGPGVSEVRYMRHDPENPGEGINFVSQGYFIMDIGIDATWAALTTGSIKIMWDTGSGISSAIFAVVATASEVQAALRTIPGWEGVTVELWGSRKGGTSAAAHILSAHQFKVTFAAGYDDMGKSPTFYTMTTSDGAYADANGAIARLYDQRFSNSIWLGKTTGYFEVLVDDTEATADAKFTAVGATSSTTLDILPQNGDTYYFTSKQFGAGGFDTTDRGTVASTGSSGTAVHGAATPTAGRITTNKLKDIPVKGTGADQLRFAYLQSGATSRQTSHYFAVGSTVEVLGTTWDDGSCSDTGITTQAACTGNDGGGTARAWTDATQTTVTDYSNNVYRKFKVTGHVTNEFNTEFAKLDAFPAAEANSQPVATTGSVIATLPDYNLKITSNNGTVRSYVDTYTKFTDKEVQVVIIGTGIGTLSASLKLSYKGEMSQDMDQASTEAQIAEEINGFSALSGPVTVTDEGDSKFKVTFNALDGDVAQLEAHTTSGQTVSVVTRENGWSIEGPIGANLDTMQAGGTINVTAKEVCSFTVDDADGSEEYYFCYDGVCGGLLTGTMATNLVNTYITTKIVDDNNVAILGTAAATYASGDKDANPAVPDVFAITLPLGKSCDGLEMRVKTLGNTGKIVKSVNKHNNGKVFKIKRSFLQIEETTPGSLGAADSFDFADGKGHSTQSGVSTLVISAGAGTCAAHIAPDASTVGDVSLPFNRKITGISTTDSGTTTQGHGGIAGDAAIDAVVDTN